MDNNNLKIYASRILLTLGFFLQLLLMLNSGTTKISSLAFLIIGISALFVFLAEAKSIQYTITGYSRIINIVLLIAISVLAYKINNKFI